jgi:hypothetical protein
MSSAEFEVDRGFDPEWSLPAEPMEEPSSKAVPVVPTSQPEDLVPIMPFPLPVPESSSTEPGEGDVLLTDVASDSDLFSDPSLEVAHMADGQTREIIVPVMLGEGASARRFKLAIRLRLDAIE